MAFWVGTLASSLMIFAISAMSASRSSACTCKGFVIELAWCLSLHKKTNEPREREGVIFHMRLQLLQPFRLQREGSDFISSEQVSSRLVHCWIGHCDTSPSMHGMQRKWIQWSWKNWLTGPWSRIEFGARQKFPETEMSGGRSDACNECSASKSLVGCSSLEDSLDLSPHAFLSM